MAIQDLKKYIVNLWGFDFIDEHLPGNVRTSDIDGAIERNGNLLLFEFKKTDTKIKAGQSRMFRQATQKNNITWIVIVGDPGWIHDKDPVIDSIIIWYRGVSYKIDNALNDHLKILVKQWWGCADSDDFGDFDKFVTDLIIYNVMPKWWNK